jgi:hypothetical protein
VAQLEHSKDDDFLKFESERCLPVGGRGPGAGHEPRSPQECGDGPPEGLNITTALIRVFLVDSAPNTRRSEAWKPNLALSDKSETVLQPPASRFLPETDSKSMLTLTFPWFGHLFPKIKIICPLCLDLCFPISFPGHRLQGPSQRAQADIPTTGHTAARVAPLKATVPATFFRHVPPSISLLACKPRLAVSPSS